MTLRPTYVACLAALCIAMLLGGCDSSSPSDASSSSAAAVETETAQAAVTSAPASAASPALALKKVAPTKGMDWYFKDDGGGHIYALYSYPETEADFIVGCRGDAIDFYISWVNPKYDGKSMIVRSGGISQSAIATYNADEIENMQISLPRDSAVFDKMAQWGVEIEYPDGDVYGLPPGDAVAKLVKACRT